MRKIAWGASLLAALAAAPALAQGTQGAATTEGGGSGDVMVLSEWNYDELYANGWSVEEMMDEASVTGPDGEEIGDIENLVFADDGKLLAVIAEVGGLWDIGDTHISVPWEQVTFSEDAMTLQIPVTEDTVADYPVFQDLGDTIGQSEAGQVAEVAEDVETAPDVFTATELIGDQAYLNEDLRYGYVSDVVVRDGAISAIVVDAAAYGRPGYFAYPWYGYGERSPEPGRYDLPFGKSDADMIENFDYDRLRPAEEG